MSSLSEAVQSQRKFMNGTGYYSKLIVGADNLSVEDVVGYQNRVLKREKRLAKEDPKAGAVAPSTTANLFKDPLIKETMKNLNGKAYIQMYEQFLQMYNGPIGDMDVKYRLGESLYKKTDLTQNMFTDPNGSIYTRSLYNLDTTVYSKPGDAGSKEICANLYFPPYNNGHDVAAVPSLNSFGTTLTDEQSGTFNKDTFRVQRLGVTYRGLGYKAVNDLIEMVQWMFEGITGIVSTYSTEWDLSLYIQEGLLSLDANKSGQIEPLHLTYRMHADNPGGYTKNNDECYVFGVINAATSKFTCEKEWKITKYPLSAYWAPYNDASVLYKKAVCPDPLTTESLFELADTVQKFDTWNAIKAGWGDWAMPIYKALYPSSSDGLDDSDLEDFSNEISEEDYQDEDGNNVGSDIYSGTSSSDKGRKTASKANRQTDKYGNGSAFVKKASAAVDGADWMGATTENTGTDNSSTALSVGLNHRNPCFYGGPHGSGLSPKVAQASFDSKSHLLRNVPRINFKGDDTSSRAQNLKKHYVESHWTKAKNWKKELFEYGDSVKAEYYVTIYRWETREDDYYIGSYPYYHGYYGYYSYYNYDYYYRNYYTRHQYYSDSNKPGSWNVYYAHKHLYNYYYGWYGGCYDGWWMHETYQTKVTDYKLQSTRAYDCMPNINWGIRQFTTVIGGVWHNDTAKKHLNWLNSWCSLENKGLLFKNDRSSIYRLVAGSYAGKSTVGGDISGSFSWNKYTEESSLLQLIKDTQNQDWNDIFLFGPIKNGVNDFIVKCKVRWQSFTIRTEQSHSHRSHGCHGNHYAWYNYEYAQIDMSSIEIIDSHLSTNPWSNYNKDLLQNPEVTDDGKIGERINIYYTYDEARALTASDVGKKFYKAKDNTYCTVEYNEVKKGYVYTAFKNVSGTPNIFDTDWCLTTDPWITIHSGSNDIDGFSGQGLLKSLPGYLDDGLDKLDPNMTFGNFTIKKFRHAGKAVSSYLNGNNCPVYPADYARSYTGDGSLPSSMATAIRNAYVSSIFVDKDGYCYRVFNLNSVRNAYVGLRNMSKMAENIASWWKIINADKLKAIYDEIIGNNVKTAKPGTKYYNPFAFSREITKSTYVDSGKSSAVAYANSLKSLADRIENVSKKDWTSWTVKEYYDTWTAMQSIQNDLIDSQAPQFIGDLWVFLNFLYETRQYFNGKRFNKCNGTYYTLRHLEQLNIAACAQNLIVDVNTNLAEGSAGRYQVIYTEVQNTVAVKAKALANNEVLEPDKITKLYLKVNYPKGVTTDEEAIQWEKTHGWKEGDEHLLIKTSLREGDTYYDPKKVWAIKPKDAVYQVRSVEWDDNEANKALKKSRIQANQDASDIEIYDYDKCVKNIKWGDEPSLTPISRGNLVGINPSSYTEYMIAAGDDANIMNAICYSQEVAEYWTVDVTDATTPKPRAEGYKTDVCIKPYKPGQEDEVEEPEYIEDVFYDGRMYPVVEDQGVIVSALQDLKEIKTTFRQNTN